MFLSQQKKRNLIITNKNGKYELINELPNAKSKNPKIFVITSTNKNKKFIWKFLISRVVNKGREGLIPLLLHFIPMFLDHHEGFTAGLQFFWHQQNIYQYHKSNLEISNENATTSTPLCSTQVA